jgi:hypothetical protein
LLKNHEFIAGLLKKNFAVAAIEKSAAATNNSAESASNSSVTDAPPAIIQPGESDNVHWRMNRRCSSRNEV